MGGGDLNTKKSWHPSTLKNQERVWKAEQAAAEEKKRIVELQRERAQENDRAQLNELAQRNFGAGGSNQVGDNRLHWMYDKPDKQVQHEDYLLGKEIGKSDESEKLQNAIPAVSRRVVGSSMLKSADDTQVDLVRKLREDPLLLVKERERAARAALLNNPLQRKRLAELLRKEKEQKESKGELKTMKKSKNKDKNLDDILAAKLNALGEKKIDLSRLLNSDDSSSESSQSSDEKSKKKKKRKKEKVKKQSKKNKKKRKSSDSDNNSPKDSDDVRNGAYPDNMYTDMPKHQSYYGRNSESTSYDRRSDHKNVKSRETNDNYRKKIERSDEYNYSNRSKHTSSESKKRRSDSCSENDSKTKKKREYSYRNINDLDERHKQADASNGRDVKKSKGRERRQGMSEVDRAAKLAEMAAAGREREVERGERVAQQRAADASARAADGARPRALRNEAHALPDSLESRIRSNRHYIQRDQMHMNQHFARR